MDREAEARRIGCVGDGAVDEIDHDFGLTSRDEELDGPLLRFGTGDDGLQLSEEGGDSDPAGEEEQTALRCRREGERAADAEKGDLELGNEGAVSLLGLGLEVGAEREEAW